MDYGTVHGIITLVAMIAFLSVCWWAYRPANKARFEADARVVIDTDPILGPKSGASRGDHS